MRSMKKLLERLDIDLPVVQAPMASVSSPELAAAVANAGGLGSYGCARLSPAEVIEEAGRIRALSNRSFNLNFFCHAPPKVTAEQEQAWRARLAPYYTELGIAQKPASASFGGPFDEAMCEAVISIRPKVVSFHFGMPDPRLTAMLKDAGCVLMSSATTVAEARHLVELGCEAIIAQGLEAGGHRGMFLSDDLNGQVGTLALVPQVVDAVEVPVIAAGGITDARGAAAAFALGADAVQVGTAYLFCPEARVSAVHRAALKDGRDDATALTNVFTGRPARGIVNRLMREVGPISEDALAFPRASEAVQPLSAEGARRGSPDFSALWSGQAVALGREIGAAELTRSLAAASFTLLTNLSQQAKAAGLQ